MNIALIGLGKMGKTIEELARKLGHNIALKINSETASLINTSSFDGIDVAIEFTRPDTAFDNVIKCLKAGIPVVSGTTGWNDQVKTAQEYCLENKGSFFYSINFSIGVNLFFEINQLLASLMNNQPQYDEILLHESHHSGKLDSPSGTAIAIANQIIGKIKRLKHWVNYKTDENVNLSNDSEGELPIFSTREDEIAGTHIVKYFCDNDEIEIMHKALTRDGFAFGAISAAEWLIGKEGIFGMKDLLKL
jgi:4-hydroxy-tetrahydrodipicolinate reductase